MEPTINLDRFIVQNLLFNVHTIYFRGFPFYSEPLKMHCHCVETTRDNNMCLHSCMCDAISDELVYSTMIAINQFGYDVMRRHLIGIMIIRKTYDRIRDNLGWLVAVYLMLRITRIVP